MNTKILAVVEAIAVTPLVLGVMFATGIIGSSTIGKSNLSPTMTGYVFNGNNELTVFLASAQTGVLTKAQVCVSSNSCCSEAITFSYPGKLYLNLNNMVGATFAFQYYSNYTIILTHASGYQSFQVHYADPYGPTMSYSSFNNSTAVIMGFAANGIYTQCWSDECGSGTIEKPQVCYNSSCYTETTTHTYPGQVLLNLNNMSLIGTAFTFINGYTYKVVLTDQTAQATVGR